MNIDIPTLSGWIGSIIVGVITGLVVLRSYLKLYKKFRVEVEAVKDDVDGIREQMKEFNAMKYRLDILEGKHLQGRQFGQFGLPQPRNRRGEKNDGV